MSRLIIICHPNDEPLYQKNNEDSRQIILWNCSRRHKRKLIRRDGVFLDVSTGMIDYAPLYFWGEYEPYSCAHVYSEAPAIHDDLKSVRNFSPTVIANMQNTDPYVFGSRFRYCCCKKTGKLYRGDIVLFGHFDNNRFYFDTVFVFKQEVNILNKHFENQYYLTAIRPTEKSSNKTITSYAEGLMYKDHEEYFSFVPCKVGDWSIDECERNKRFPYSELPSMNIRDFGLEELNVRNKNIVTFKDEMWNLITKAVTDANMKFGIHLAEI